MSHISKDQTVQYILTSLDDMLTEDPSRAEAFREYAARRKESVWTHFLNMLNRPDHFIVNQTARIITKIACWQGGAHRQLMEGSDLIYFLSWISGQLKQFNNEYLQNILKCLQLMLRLDEYRKVFVHQIDGLAVY
jgi:V-type H+-transporting ATPase subunit H